jgi:hypothetical protein
LGLAFALAGAAFLPAARFALFFAAERFGAAFFVFFAFLAFLAFFALVFAFAFFAMIVLPIVAAHPVRLTRLAVPARRCLPDRDGPAFMTRPVTPPASALRSSN